MLSYLIGKITLGMQLFDDLQVLEVADFDFCKFVVGRAKKSHLSQQKFDSSMLKEKRQLHTIKTC